MRIVRGTFFVGVLSVCCLAQNAFADCETAAISIAGDGRTILKHGESFIDLNSWKHIRSWRDLLRDSIAYVTTASRDGSKIYVYSDNEAATNPQVTIWHARSGRMLQSFKPHRSDM